MLGTGKTGTTIVRDWRISHEGNPKAALLEFLRLPETRANRIAVTGRHFRHAVALSSLSEPEAVEHSLQAEYGLNGTANTFPNLVISAGGETQLAYRVAPNGGIVSVRSGNKCASGTGEFFLQQIRRMGLTPEEAIRLAGSGVPHKVAGRCSVFCKSDCTHALNKGEPKANVVAGLCRMMADKLVELVGDWPTDRVALIGGGALNPALLRMLQETFPGLHTPRLGRAFEAYGAALWALRNPCLPLGDNPEKLFGGGGHSFPSHPPLCGALNLVEFKTIVRHAPKSGDECILGLDVGSTTTKVVLMRTSDFGLTASAYLRTNGNPIEAARQCYTALLKLLAGTQVRILGLGVTGSGRQLAALHALTPNVINEIVAHAAAAIHFDPAVDTIFEIGGQDAKYTHLAAGVPADYAMNEACSAGTGSFLEESALESLNIPTENIGALALEGLAPPNFNDQCAAFISSDIKRATQEGVGRNDLLAGLVYSICLNYLNRVKGARPVGRRIFMQGGVCYNKAVPVAMAALLRTPIVVPPEPGLMGAFGVALETRRILETGHGQTGEIDLAELAERQAVVEGDFICAGGRDHCDRQCRINRIRVRDKIHSFGGACDRYTNLRFQRDVETGTFDGVAQRQRLLFEHALLEPAPDAQQDGRTVGLMRSFLTYSLLPLYSTFFSRLGLRVMLSEPGDTTGVGRTGAAFCLPAALSHAACLNLLGRRPDFLFAPHIMQMPIANAPTFSRTCVFVQGEPYVLRSTFRRELEAAGTKMLSPIFRMQAGFQQARESFVRLGMDLGKSSRAATLAFDNACASQLQFEAMQQKQGRELLASLEDNPDTFGLVLFGRAYNAFAGESNMGIPHKIASRGFHVIPCDMLPLDDATDDHSNMYWATGQKLMRAARFVRDRDNLFGVYVTHFSCGPDSFLIGFFRNIMDGKPSLTLELDHHTADAGLDTRIEAALDIIRGHRRTAGRGTSQNRTTFKRADGDFCNTDELGTSQVQTSFQPARVQYGRTPRVFDSAGIEHAITDPRVELLLPSMGSYPTQAFAAILRRSGIRARALPMPDEETLLLGRRHATCKECLPFLLTTGAFLSELARRQEPDRISLLFMATGNGPCRLGQYCRALDELIVRERLRNVAVFTLSDENGYAELGWRVLLRSWQALVLTDILCDIRSLLAVDARDPEQALTELDSAWQDFLGVLEHCPSREFAGKLSGLALRLGRIPLARDPRQTPVISLVGEIYVRREEFSRRHPVRFLQERGFIVRIAPASEYLAYTNYLINNGLRERALSARQRLGARITTHAQTWWENRIRRIMAQSGLCPHTPPPIGNIIRNIQHLVDPNFRSETILTVGLAMNDILHDACGVIAIGPFGCMPFRVAEAILKREMTLEGKARMPGWAQRVEHFRDLDPFPLLAVETDGSAMPQQTEAALEAFALQARRLHERMRSKK